MGFSTSFRFCDAVYELQKDLAAIWLIPLEQFVDLVQNVARSQSPIAVHEVWLFFGYGLWLKHRTWLESISS
jgi:hypothetical protein